MSASFEPDATYVARPPLPRRLRVYLRAIIQLTREEGPGLASLILFGSAVTGGFADEVSDVDLILVLPDDAPPEAKLRLREEVERLEILHGFRVGSARGQRAFDSFVRRVTANVRSFFICSRGDFLSGDPARVLDLARTQAFFVDRVVIPSIVNSAVTVWGENLLPHVAIQPIRRFDVCKAFFAFWHQVLLSAALFPLVPSATQYAMAALKRSVHNCYFCYHHRRGALEVEIEFFRQHLGRSRTLEQLLALRREAQRSFGFVVRCMPALVRLHFRTALHNPFPAEDTDESC